MDPVDLEEVAVVALEDPGHPTPREEVDTPVVECHTQVVAMEVGVEVAAVIQVPHPPLLPALAMVGIPRRAKLE